jgi:hypothetical protein
VYKRSIKWRQRQEVYEEEEEDDDDVVLLLHHIAPGEGEQGGGSLIYRKVKKKKGKCGRKYKEFSNHPPTPPPPSNKGWVGIGIEEYYKQASIVAASTAADISAGRDGCAGQQQQHPFHPLRHTHTHTHILDVFSPPLTSVPA